MKFFLRASVFLCALSSVDIVQAQSEYPETAHETIEAVFNELFSDLDGLLEIYDKSPEDFYVKVDEVVSPWIDYANFSKGVMGAKYYPMASEEQRSRFESVFRQSVIQIYAKSLLGIEDPEFEVDPPAEGSEGETTTRVRQTLSSGTGGVVVLYSMGLSEEGRWQVRNVLIEGTNFGLMFRNQFARSAQEYDEDLNLVIENWDSEA